MQQLALASLYQVLLHLLLGGWLHQHALLLRDAMCLPQSLARAAVVAIVTKVAKVNVLSALDGELPRSGGPLARLGQLACSPYVPHTVHHHAAIHWRPLALLEPPQVPRPPLALLYQLVHTRVALPHLLLAQQRVVQPVRALAHLSQRLLVPLPRLRRVAHGLNPRPLVPVVVPPGLSLVLLVQRQHRLALINVATHLAVTATATVTITITTVPASSNFFQPTG